jgi:tetratricopeptide (TPR) repeat protein
LDFLINQLRGDLRWLKEPRFAIISWAIALFSVFAAFGVVWVAGSFLMLAFLGCTRLVLFRLLPHEKVSLKKAEFALANAEPDKAISILRSPPFFIGIYYQLKCAILLSSAYCEEGQFLKAYDILSTMNERNLLSSEVVELRLAWIRLYIAAENIEEAGRRLQRVTDCGANLMDCLLLKGIVAFRQKKIDEARRYFEQGLDSNPAPLMKMQLLINLANVEGEQGRSSAQLDRLKAARFIFHDLTQANLTSVLHHNLAISFARNNQPDKAREILREAWTAGSQDNLRHVLEVLNNFLLTARELSDIDLKRQVYEEFERQLKRLGPLSKRECFLLDISQLRMRRNDEIFLKNSNYVVLIERLLNSYGLLPAATPAGERIAGLKEIFYDLKIELELTSNVEKVAVLIKLLRHVADLLLKNKNIVDVTLCALPPTLIGPVTIWRNFQVDMDKAEILLAEKAVVADDAIKRLFKHLQEKAEWLTEEGDCSTAINAWIVVCDQYISYHDQTPQHARPDLRKKYLPLAEHALEQAVKILENQPHYRHHVDHLIGVAFFTLLLHRDKKSAARWVKELQNLHPAMDQYASWLRNHYQWVLQQLETTDSDRILPGIVE